MTPDLSNAPIIGRRSFLAMVAALPIVPAFARTPTVQAPDVGRKFGADGRVRDFAGNTIICHLPQQGPDAACFNALLDIYRAAPGLGFMRKIGLLPPSSYHMTVFGGANDQDRRVSNWPNNVPLDTPLADCNRIFAERLKAFRLDTPLPILMRVDHNEPPVDDMPLKIRIVGHNETENDKLRRLRDRLSQVLGMRAPDHAAYYFHITLGYLIAPFTRAEQEQCSTAVTQWRQSVMKAAPVIALGAPEFCTFRDMFAFDRQFYLR